MGTILYRGPGVGVTAAPANLLLDTYTGALAAYSFRKLRTAYAGSAVRIRESGGNTEADIGFDGSGNFDTATAATHIGGGSGFIAKWYDQSGNSDDLVQATSSTQPSYVASGIGSKACLFCNVFNGYNMKTVTDSVALNSSSVSVAAVAYLNSNTTNYGRLISFIASGTGTDASDTKSGALILRDASNQNVAAYRNAELGVKAVTYDTPNVLMSVFDGSNHNIYVNNGTPGSAASSGTMGGASGGTLSMSADNGVGSNWHGQVSEIVIWASDQTANVAGIDGVIGTYYGL